MLRRKRFSEEIANEIQCIIAERGLGEGEKLPSHAKLAEQLRISIPSLREGLQRLAALGVVRIEHGRGTIVAQPAIGQYLTVAERSALSATAMPHQCVAAMRPLLDKAVSPLLASRSARQSIMESDLFVKPADSADQVAEAYTAVLGILAGTSHNPAVSQMVLLGGRLLVQNPGARAALHEDCSNIRDEVRRIVSAADALDADAARTVLHAHLDRVSSVLPGLREVSCATGPLGGTFHQAGIELHEIAAVKGPVSLRVLPTAGGDENIRLLKAGSVDVALVQVNAAIAAIQADSDSASRASQIRLIALTHSLELWVVTLKETPASELASLSGATVGIGNHGSETARIAEELLSAAEQRCQDVSTRYLSVSQAADALADGSIEAFFYLSSGPNAAISRLASRRAIRVLPIDADLITEICDRLPACEDAEFAPFPNHQPIHSIRLQAALACCEDLPPETARALRSCLLIPHKPGCVLAPQPVPKDYFLSPHSAVAQP